VRKLSLAISPCPNDTFMFYGMIHGKVDHDFDLEVAFHDIEELNKYAIADHYDISKISFSLLSQIAKRYYLLSSGSALGKACGPLLISKSLDHIEKANDYHCLIPGINTTANFLLSTLYPNITSKEETLFSEIESRLISREAPLGLVIHETRFTYEEKGLTKITDLGEEWEEQTGLPIPLGGIVARRSLAKSDLITIQKAIKESIQYAYDNQEEVLEFCKSYAQDMRPEVMKSHIDLYVNEYSLDLGETGYNTIRFMLDKMKETRQIDEIPSDLFI